MGKFDVFVCCNNDGFGLELHSALKDAKIKCVTSEDLKQGRVEIGKLMKKAKIFIVVLSRSFAKNSDCLNELQQIVEHRNKNKQNNNIIPIFYEVDPSDIRKQRGDFQIGSEEVKAIEALKTVANIKGLDSCHFKSDDELKKVTVEDLREKLAEIKSKKISRVIEVVGVIALGAALFVS